MNTTSRNLLITTLLFTLSTVAVAQKKRDKAKVNEAETPVVVQPAPAPAPTPEPNGSLFSNQGASTSLVTDFKPRNVGDLVFVDVVEESNAAVTSGASRSRDSGTISGVTNAIASIPISGAAITSQVVGAMGQRKFEGEGQTGRQSSLNARIVARVVEVLPNGDMRIEAHKMVKVNKENEKLTLTGIVRSRDVSNDNAIPSSSVGELKVALNGKGVASADNEPGWLFRLLDKISPF